MEQLFVTGTGTGVGKTLVSTALALAFAKRDRPTLLLKPVQTGCTRQGDDWLSPDLAWAGGRFATVRRRAPIDGVVLRGYATPCSPHLAARLEEEPLPYEALVKAARHCLESTTAAVVEGAGGIRTPLTDTHDWLDFLRDVPLPVVVVATTGLGTLNHTRLTVDALRAAGCALAGLVLTQPEPGPWGAIEKDNAESLPRLTALPLLAVLKHQARASDPAACARWLARAGESMLERMPSRRTRKTKSS